MLIEEKVSEKPWGSDLPELHHLHRSISILSCPDMCEVAVNIIIEALSMLLGQGRVQDGASTTQLLSVLCNQISQAIAFFPSSARPRVLEMDKEENRHPSASRHHRHSSSSENYRRRSQDSDKHRESSGRKVKMRRHWAPAVVNVHLDVPAPFCVLFTLFLLDKSPLPFSSCSRRREHSRPVVCSLVWLLSGCLFLAGKSLLELLITVLEFKRKKDLKSFVYECIETKRWHVFFVTKMYRL